MERKLLYWVILDHTNGGAQGILSGSVKKRNHLCFNRHTKTGTQWEIVRPQSGGDQEEFKPGMWECYVSPTGESEQNAEQTGGRGEQSKDNGTGEVTDEHERERAREREYVRDLVVAAVIFWSW